MASSVTGFVPGSSPAYLRRRTQRGGTTAGRYLVVQQAAERPEHELVKAEVGDLEPIPQLGSLDRVGRGLDQDLEILLDARVGLGAESADQLRVDLPDRLEVSLDEAGRQVGDLVVVALDAELAAASGSSFAISSTMSFAFWLLFLTQSATGRGAGLAGG